MNVNRKVVKNRLQKTLNGGNPSCYKYKANREDVCEAVPPLFYGYNPFYAVAFFFVWYYSLEEWSENLVQTWLDALGYPMGLVPDYLPVSQNLDWP